MMSKKHHVVLSGGEREQLLDRIHRGGGSAQDLAHARILLKADEGADGPGWKDEQIADGARREPADRRAGAQAVCDGGACGGAGAPTAAARTSRGSSTVPRKRS